MSDATGGATPRPIRVRYGKLSDREHAIYEAHKWQVAHAAENTPTPSEAYVIIGELLRQLPYKQVLRAIQKGDQQAHG